MSGVIAYKEVEDRIIELRGQKLLLDVDVAELYGVKTKEVNQAVKNNPGKFPFGYLIELDRYEKAELVKNFDRFNKLKYSVVPPTAFTERGLYMLATILKSAQAVQATIAIIDTFTQVRQLSRKMDMLQSVTNSDEQKVLLKEGGELMANVIGENLTTSATETEIELNFALVKIKHKIKRDAPKS